MAHSVVLSMETLAGMCLLDQGRPMTHKTTILILKHVYHRCTFMEYITDLPNYSRTVTHPVIYYNKTRDRKNLRKGICWLRVQGTQFIMVE